MCNMVQNMYALIKLAIIMVIKRIMHCLYDNFNNTIALLHKNLKFR